MSGFVTDFNQLEVYEETMAVALRIFELSNGFPREEAYALSAQLRRASRSIGAQIAEAWGTRRYPRHFVAKLSDADAEQLETRHWLSVAVDCGFVSSEDAGDLAGQLDKIGRMLNVMMQPNTSARTIKRQRSQLRTAAPPTAAPPTAAPSCLLPTVVPKRA